VAERFEARQILELGVVDKVVANLSDEQLDNLRQLYAELKAFITPEGLVSDYFGFLDKDREFHRALVRIAGNRLLLEIYDGLNLNLQMAKVFYLARDKRVTAVDQEHQQILKALEARDAEALKEAIRNHIQSSKQAVVPSIEAGRLYDAHDTSSAPDEA
jgi:DNA-binding GntR family transcriptional regulator